jgi:hypothetical protein
VIHLTRAWWYCVEVILFIVWLCIKKDHLTCVNSTRIGRNTHFFNKQPKPARFTFYWSVVSSIGIGRIIHFWIRAKNSSYHIYSLIPILFLSADGMSVDTIFNHICRHFWILNFKFALFYLPKLIRLIAYLPGQLRQIEFDLILHLLILSADVVGR